MELYHVTPKVNLDGISSDGIDPSYSTGKMNVCWFVEVEMIDWAIAHVARKRKVKMGDLIVLLCVIQQESLIRTRWSHVWAYSGVAVHRATMPVKDALKLTLVRNERDYIPF